MDLENLFSKAVNEESYRQEFLDALMEKGVPDYIRNIRYETNPEQNNVGTDLESVTLMATTGSRLSNLHIKGTKSKITVYPESFDLKNLVHKNLDDFLSTLEDHEYFHAKEIYESPELIRLSCWKHWELDLLNWKYRFFMMSHKSYIDSLNVFGNYCKEFRRMFELRAVNNKLECISKRKCSLEFVLHLMLKKSELDPGTSYNIKINGYDIIYDP